MLINGLHAQVFKLTCFRALRFRVQFSFTQQPITSLYNRHAPFSLLTLQWDKGCHSKLINILPPFNKRRLFLYSNISPFLYSINLLTIFVFLEQWTIKHQPSVVAQLIKLELLPRAAPQWPCPGSSQLQPTTVEPFPPPGPTSLDNRFPREKQQSRTPSPTLPATRTLAPF